MLNVGSDFSGVGAFNQSLNRLELKYEEKFACEMDSHARHTFIINYGVDKDLSLLTHPDVIFCNKMYMSFSKHGNFNKQTFSDVKKLAKIQDKTAKLFSFYYPWNVKRRKVPKESLDIYMTSPPCQAFSLAGKRKGEEDKRGVLFYNSHEFIHKNRPRFFIFENVKGLISDNQGRTFQRWIDLLGGKSVNGNPVIFPHEHSVPYHIYYNVLNSKHYGVPQNRERVFIIGIRDEKDNNFTWPVEIELKKRLKDVLETFETSNFKSEDVFKLYMEKYFLSDIMIEGFVSRNNTHKKNGNGFNFNPTDGNSIAKTITNPSLNRTDDNYIKIGYINQDTQESQVYSENGVSPTLTAGTKGYSNGYIIKEVKVCGLLTGGKWDKTHEQSGRVYDIDFISPTIHTMGGGNQEPKILKEHRIRKLTPRECFRLMDFPESFKWNTSDSQAYKQAGNSIVISVLTAIIKKLKI